jgi:hypothetical protein
MRVVAAPVAVLEAAYSAHETHYSHSAYPPALLPGPGTAARGPAALPDEPD